MRLIEASINDDDVLAELPRDLDYVFHLSTYHGNQSSMADPLADHEHNTLTTLKLYEALKDFEGLRRVVYASAGCTVAEKTFEGAEATQEDAPEGLRGRLEEDLACLRILQRLRPQLPAEPSDAGCAADGDERYQVLRLHAGDGKGLPGRDQRSL